MSEMPYHPEGFATLVPFFSVVDAPRFIAFLEGAFGAECTMRMEEEGKIRHAEVRIGGAMIELCEAREAARATHTAIHLFVPDAAATHAAALEAGATQTYAVTDHDYGERSGGVCDAWGNDWYIATVTDQEKRRAE